MIHSFPRASVSTPACADALPLEHKPSIAPAASFSRTNGPERMSRSLRAATIASGTCVAGSDLNIAGLLP